jgi:hypothetical protein
MLTTIQDPFCRAPPENLFNLAEHLQDKVRLRLAMRAGGQHRKKHVPPDPEHCLLNVMPTIQRELFHDLPGATLDWDGNVQAHECALAAWDVHQ